MVTGDGAYIKKINRSLILQKIIEHGMISRAELSKITGLNKATISIQVATLLEEDLVYETRQEHNAVGRRPIMLSIKRDAGYVLGIDLDYQEIQFTLSDLLGYPVYNEYISLEEETYENIVLLLANNVQKYHQRCNNCRYGLISTVIGIHGTVNKEEDIFFVPRYKWYNKNLKSDLKNKLDFDLNIHIDNNANLSSYAEKVYHYEKSDNLLNIILSSGIGAGIMVNSHIHKGYHGYAGEMGHMVISPEGPLCKCGNHGCWELYASEPSLFKKIAKRLDKPVITQTDFCKLVNENHPVVYEEMEVLIKYLSIGLNNIINLYNPETIVLNSEVLQSYPSIVEKIKRNLVSSVSQYGEIVLSKLGKDACIMGACAIAIQNFFEVPKLIFSDSIKHIPVSNKHVETVNQ
ncbi:ROK family transcriptional regulator [Oceanobacillus rekensis]|uniref:ROK family transcriptional regulator n=1 Tax=Oceanobacillus rekensis TaxID=937927 RepID=UPI000B430BA6|nr:ROK family transcriptional regulator [Oceanobacillus rekensis]